MDFNARSHSTNGEKSMVRIAVLGLSLIAVGVDAGWAQDIAGIEDCTKTSGLDKRTGCLQSNVNFLHRLVTKNALDARQKPEAAVLPRQLNISGLSLSLIGVLLLFFFGMPYRIRSEGQSYIVTEQTSAAEKAKDALFSKLGFAGLVLIALGTFLQIVGTWVSP
jgi:hypothetical protein